MTEARLTSAAWRDSPLPDGFIPPMAEMPTLPAARTARSGRAACRMVGSVRTPAHAVRFPLITVLLCFSATAGLVVWLWVGKTRLEQQSVALAYQVAEVVGLRGDILLMDEILTGALHMAAETGEDAWVARYRETDPVMAAALSRAIMLAPPTVQAQVAALTGDDDGRLIALNRKILDWVTRGNLGEAHTLVTSADYQEQRTRFIGGLSVLMEGLMDMLADRELTLQRDSSIDFFISATAGSVIFLAWTILVNTLFSWERALVTSRREREKEEVRYRQLFATMIDGCALGEILVDCRGIACDLRFLAVNPAFESVTGLAADAIVGRRLRDVMPGVDPCWIDRCRAVATTGDPKRFIDDSRPTDHAPPEVRIFRVDEGRVGIILHDVSAPITEVGAP